ncbi:MAG: TldD/PmbA family protein [Eubacteriales bacterium]
MTDRHNLANYILQSFTKAGADMAECHISDKVKTEIYYESGKISMIRTNFDTSVSMKAIKDNKKGTVSTNSTEHEVIDGCIAQAMSALESSIPDDAEGICDVPDMGKSERGVLVPDKEGMYNGLKKFIAECKEKYPQISFDSITIEHDAVTSLYRNTKGTDLVSTNGFYVFSPSFMAVQDGKTSSMNYSYVLFNDITKPFMKLGMIENVISDTVKQIETVPVNGKFVGDVILTPSCFEDMFSSVVSNFMSERSLIDGTSIFKDSLGKKVAADSFSIWSQPRNTDLPGGYFMTGDGYVAQNMPLIEDGVLKNFVLGRYGAKKTGNKRSSSAGGNLVMKAGEHTLDEMIASVKKGLIVSRFSGGSPGGSGDFSGVAKNSFLVEDGKITCAVSETMISGNLAKLLLDIKESSKELVNTGDSILPWVKVSDIVISGK